MNTVKAIDIFEVVNFPNLMPEKEKLKQLFIENNYSCAKVFTLAEVTELFAEDKICDILNVFHKSITENQKEKLTQIVCQEVIQYMEKSYLHKKFPTQYQTIISVRDKTLSQEDAEGLINSLKDNFCLDFGDIFPDCLTRDIEKAKITILGLYNEKAALFTIKAVNDLIFNPLPHKHALPLHKKLSKDAKAFEEGKLINRSDYNKQLYNAIVNA